MALFRYELDDFERVISGGFKCTLDANVIKIVQTIADQVGSPEYVSTPHFDKKDRAGIRHERGHDKGRSRNNKRAQEISDEAWNDFRKFETTQLKKSEGIDKSIDQIRKAINKISNKTYASISEQLIEALRHIVDTGTMEDKQKAATTLFTISSTNTLVNELCARLYAELLPDFDFLDTPVKSCLSKFETSYAEIVYVNPDNDYDEFCKNNKHNQNRRAIAKFIINLYKQSVLDDASVSCAIAAIGVAVKECLLNNKNEPGILEELLETVYDMISVDINIIKHLDGWSTLKDAIILITTSDVNKTQSLSHRARFKAMDILDQTDK